MVLQVLDDYLVPLGSEELYKIVPDLLGFIYKNVGHLGNVCKS